MNINDLSSRVSQLGNAWEHFRSSNEERLAQIEKKGAADPLTLNKLNQVNDALDEYKGKISRIEAAISRPDSAHAGEAKFSSEEELEHKAAFCNYLRKGAESELSAIETKALGADTGSEGGFLVSPAMSELIAGKITHNSVVRRLASVQEISTGSLDVISDDNAYTTAWAAENTAATDTSNAALSKKTITAYDLVAQPKATQKLIDDSSIDIEEWLAVRLADIFLKEEDNAFINGDGTNKPTGILSYPAGTGANQIEQINSGVDSDLGTESILNLYYALDEEFSNNASFVMSRAMVQKVRLLQDANNQYLWNPALLAGQDDTLLGVPVLQSVHVPSPALDSLSVILGDFKSGYQIVDRNSVSILRDPFTDKPFVKFYTTKRVGGDVINTKAFKIMKLTDGI